MNRAYLFFLSFFFTLHATYFDDPATVLVTVPVTDLVTKNLHHSYPTISIEELYTLPYSPQEGIDSCMRAHQCLYNEVGRVKEIDGDEALVEFPHFFCENESKVRHSSFWMLRKNIRHLADLHESLHCIPEPFRGSDRHILTLMLPWQDIATTTIYSAGTRFIREETLDTEESYGVIFLDVSECRPRTALINKMLAITDYPTTSTEAKKLFVAILKRWTTLGTIPYVWGGCSFTRTTPEDFGFVRSLREGAHIAYWDRPNTDHPRSGFDCSGLILRAAQIAGIPYFFKNTTTLSQNLQEIPLLEQLEEGDLILMKGHVMIISSLDFHTCIDTLGYSSGYAKLVERHLSEVFEDVATYEELRQRASRSTPLNMKNKQGQTMKSIQELCFFRI